MFTGLAFRRPRSIPLIYVLSKSARAKSAGSEALNLRWERATRRRISRPKPVTLGGVLLRHARLFGNTRQTRPSEHSVSNRVTRVLGLAAIAFAALAAPSSGRDNVSLDEEWWQGLSGLEKIAAVQGMVSGYTSGYSFAEVRASRRADTMAAVRGSNTLKTDSDGKLMDRLIEELLTFGDSSTSDAVCIELFESLNESDRHFGELWRRFGPTSKKCWLQMHGRKARGNE